MSKTLNQYFQLERQFLQEAAEHFIAQNPLQAARLNMDLSGEFDPHIERLMEGAAYLNARTKQQIDLGIDHVTESILRHIAPQYLTPYPSMMVVEFNSKSERFVKTHQLHRHTRLLTEYIGDDVSNIEFTTTKSILIHPFRISAIKSMIGVNGCSDIELTFKINDGVELSSIDLDEIPLFINAKASVARQWYYYFTSKITGIKIKGSDDVVYWRGLQNNIVGTNLDFDDGMMSSFFGEINQFELLKDYFLFEEKFMFISLRNIKLRPNSHEFKIELNFSESLDDVRVEPGLFKLHCVTAANIFSVSCEPISYTPKQLQYPLEISYGCVNKELISIKKVRAITASDLTTHEFIDFHNTPGVDDKSYNYRLSQLRESQEVTRNYLIFSGEIHEPMHVSVDALACNGNYPRHHGQSSHLTIGDSSLSIQLLAKNVCRPSLFLRPKFDNNFLSRVLTIINLNFADLENVDFFKEILRLHDWSRNSAKIIESISKVNFSPFTKLHKGIVVRGVIFEIIINDKNFKLSAEVYLFGVVINSWLNMIKPLNNYIETKITFEPSGKVITFGGL